MYKPMNYSCIHTFMPANTLLPVSYIHAILTSTKTKINTKRPSHVARHTQLSP